MPEATPTSSRHMSAMATLSEHAGSDGSVTSAGPLNCRERALSLACRDALTTHVALTALLITCPRSGIKDPAFRETARFLGCRWEKQVAEVCATAATCGDDLALKARLLRRMVDHTEAALIGPTVRLAASLASDVLSCDKGEAD